MWGASGPRPSVQSRELQGPCLDAQTGLRLAYDHSGESRRLRSSGDGVFESGARTQEHVLAHNESFEIVDLFELWQPYVDRFPGLRERLRQVCKKGPTLREGENTDESTNRP